MDSLLFERLLYQGEGQEVDFKSEQYRLDTDYLKGEFIKDILAFANSWRMNDAYILLGVDETKRVAGRCTVVGITHHHDDADLQQLVNGSAHTPISFHYSPFHFDGKDVGVIHIPKQTRPFYLWKEVGKLTANTVYYRLGSTTAVASIHDANHMANTDKAQGSPSIELKLIDFKAGREVDKILGINVSNREIEEDLPDYGSDGSFSASIGENRRYWRKLAEYIWAKERAASFKLSMKNQSTQLAVNLRVEITCSDKTNIADPDEFPDEPVTRFTGVNSAFQTRMRLRKRGGKSFLEIDLGNLQPNEDSEMDEAFHVFSDEGKFSLTTTIFGDNIPVPLQQSFEVKQNFVVKSMITFDELDQYQSEEE